MAMETNQAVNHEADCGTDRNAGGEILMEVRHLKKWFPVSGSIRKEKAYVKAVEDVNLTIRKGETLGIVGESGCGKSTLGRLLLRLVEPTEGEILFKGKDINKLSPEEMRKTRRYMQMVFQDPYASLNPRMRVGNILSEPYIIHGLCSEKEAKEKAAHLLEIVGLGTDSMKKYPHEFSGGQRQRICIARALAVNPDMIVCDECVSALDVSIQAQIINLLMKLQREFGVTLVFISHDLRIVQHISTNVAVMYLGEVVESGPKEELFAHPTHPYTKALLSAVPISRPGMEKKRIILKGELPSPIDRPAGCSFCTRCSMADEGCRQNPPGRFLVGEGHDCRCTKVGGMKI